MMKFHPEINQEIEDCGLIAPQFCYCAPGEFARQELIKHGVNLGETSLNSEGLVLLAEAINLASKELDYYLYELKPALFAEAANSPNVQSGWGNDGCFYLFHANVGTICAHDPFGEIEKIIPKDANNVWEHNWSGIYRQDYAFIALIDKTYRKRIATLTSPGYEMLGMS